MRRQKAGSTIGLSTSLRLGIGVAIGSITSDGDRSQHATDDPSPGDIRGGLGGSAAWCINSSPAHGARVLF